MIESITLTNKVIYSSDKVAGIFRTTQMDLMDQSLAWEVVGSRHFPVRLNPANDSLREGIQEYGHTGKLHVQPNEPNCWSIPLGTYS